MRLRHSLLVLALACAPGLAWPQGARAQGSESQGSESQGSESQGPAAFDAVDLDATVPVDKLAAQLATRRVVFIGETHDRYDHHLNQLEIIRRLYQLDPNLAIGVEYFQQPFQSQVDDYIAGRATEQEFLRAAGYYQSWGYDYRLYAPIFRFAREQRIPVRALNVPSELASTVAKVGLAGLSAPSVHPCPRKSFPPMKPTGTASAKPSRGTWQRNPARSIASSRRSWCGTRAWPKTPPRT